MKVLFKIRQDRHTGDQLSQGNEEVGQSAVRLEETPRRFCAAECGCKL